jgi:hypothetical protein
LTVHGNNSRAHLTCPGGERSDSRWFERRKSQHRVTFEIMIEPGDRYIARGDLRGAVRAVKLAERLAA